MNLVLEFDDWSARNSNFGLLEDLKEHYPQLKVTLFTIPWESRFGEQVLLTDSPQFTRAIRECADWIEVALHGLTHKQRNSEDHTPAEFENISYDEAWKRILVGEKMFINQRVPYAKIFKAPYWLLSKEGKRAATDSGFLVVEDHYYNWNLKDDVPGVPIKKDDKLWTIGHGHIQITQGNGLEECMHRILKLPTNTTFYFLSEYLGAQKVYPDRLDFRDPLEQIQIYRDGKEWK